MAEMEEKGPEVCEYPPRFGMIVVRLGFITPEQLRDAIVEQLDEDLAGKAHRPIGAILRGRGWMTSEQVDKTLQKTLQCYSL